MEAHEELLSADSAFHRGEREIQSALGVRATMEQRGQKVVRDHLPGQHRRFYEELPFIVVAARDEEERPWATLLAGPPGFIRSPSEIRLEIAGRPAEGDALFGSISLGSDVGLLGIDLARRRRNRANGRVDALSSGKIGLAVGQTFGNCPRFIVPRNWSPAPPATQARPATRAARLDPGQASRIAAAKTFFLASGYRGEGHSASFGMDASHRGGPVGFVEVLGDSVLRFPDYAGNDHYNTLGNLVLDDRMGLVFVDFEGGDLLQLTGRASIDWSTPDRHRFPGAERLVTFEIEEVAQQFGPLPIRWREDAAG